MIYKMFPSEEKQEDGVQKWDNRCPLFNGGKYAMRVLLNKLVRSDV
jgi:hypothetical protein